MDVTVSAHRKFAEKTNDLKSLQRIIASTHRNKDRNRTQNSIKNDTASYDVTYIDLY